jgi:hypothetical protein
MWRTAFSDYGVRRGRVADPLVGACSRRSVGSGVFGSGALTRPALAAGGAPAPAAQGHQFGVSGGVEPQPQGRFLGPGRPWTWLENDAFCGRRHGEFELGRVDLVAIGRLWHAGPEPRREGPAPGPDDRVGLWLR